MIKMQGEAVLSILLDSPNLEIYDLRIFEDI